MKKKVEIKVYLPYLMVGELESRRKNNARSKFIEEAIRNRLDGEESFSFKDIEDHRLMALLINRFPEYDVLKTILVNRIEELKE